MDVRMLLFTSLVVVAVAMIFFLIVVQDKPRLLPARVKKGAKKSTLTQGKKRIGKNRDETP